ncbi:hypothetical protein ACLX1H_007943 [Fusarium chlamydosporum]
MGDATFHAVDFVSAEAETVLWAAIVEMHNSSGLRRAVNMLQTLHTDPINTPRMTYIASILIHREGRYLFSRLFTIPGLLTHFCCRWTISMECLVFQPPNGGHQLARSACTNCIRSNPDQHCEWAQFTQGQKRHEREGPDSITFAGKNWALENRNASHFTPGRLNSVDCTRVCHIAMHPIVFDEQGHALRIVDPDKGD